MNKKKTEKKMSKAKIIITIIVILVAVMVGLSLLVSFFMPKTTSIEKSDVFSAEEVEVKSVAVVFALNMEDYEALQRDYADEKMKAFLTKEQIDAAKAGLNVDWDANVSFGDATVVEVKQMGQTYATAQLPVTYGDKVVTYTLTFDTDYKLAGLYMK